MIESYIHARLSNWTTVDFVMFNQLKNTKKYINNLIGIINSIFIYTIKNILKIGIGTKFFLNSWQKYFLKLKKHCVGIISNLNRNSGLKFIQIIQLHVLSQTNTKKFKLFYLFDA